MHGTSIHSIKTVQKVIFAKYKGVKHKVHLEFYSIPIRGVKLAPVKYWSFLGFEFKLNSRFLDQGC